MANIYYQVNFICKKHNTVVKNTHKKCLNIYLYLCLSISSVLHHSKVFTPVMGYPNPCVVYFTDCLKTIPSSYINTNFPINPQ